ncbi:PLP-dependent aminotransferase family protein [Sporolactobacillus sp. Y61]|uniref:PLP-dependent aminotransferase family protein n=1 Tax=Sporolactobacillus sp. Y61 TaxID=3160863 RepID=A0AAU8IIG0_9BACL
MLKVTVNSRNTHNYIYRQIYKQLKKEILMHHFLPDEKLPSKREMAGRLNVSINSVNGAYQQLLAEGYIYSIERSGFYVEKLDTIPLSDNTLNPLDPDLTEKGIPDEDWISFSHMSADKSLFPYDSWLNCTHKALNSSKAGLVDNSSLISQGVYSVRRSICRLLSITRGVKCYPEQIIIGGGTQSLIQVLCHIFPINTKYAMEEPGYNRIYQLLKLMHLDVSTIQLDNKGIDISKIKNKDLNVLYITPSHQFPTGIIMPVSRRIQLLNWASQDEDRYIIEDDYDSEFKYETNVIPSLQGLDTYEKVIYFGTFSKSLLPGFRISYMILPQKLLKKYRKTQNFLLQTSSVLTQMTLRQFIDSGEYQKHIKKMKQVYSERRIKLIKTLNKKFGDNIKIHGENAGLHFLTTFDTRKTIDEVMKRAQEEKIELYSIRRCRLNPKIPVKKQFIIGFADLSAERIEEGVERLYRAMME